MVKNVVLVEVLPLIDGDISVTVTVDASAPTCAETARIVSDILSAAVEQLS